MKKLQREQHNIYFNQSTVTISMTHTHSKILFTLTGAAVLTSMSSCKAKETEKKPLKIFKKEGEKTKKGKERAKESGSSCLS